MARHETAVQQTAFDSTAPDRRGRPRRAGRGAAPEVGAAIGAANRQPAGVPDAERPVEAKGLRDAGRVAAARVVSPRSCLVVGGTAAGAREDAAPSSRVRRSAPPRLLRLEGVLRKPAGLLRHRKSLS